MSKHISFFPFLVIVIVSQSGANPENTHNERLEDAAFSESRNGQCGGTIELDSGTLIYPGPGVVIKPGELCIWTIHLRTMDGWRMNFTDLDLPGFNAACDRAAISVYGLSNLIPVDRPERYRFCNENSNGENFFLTGNIATVVFYTGSNFQVNSTRRGFALHWEGSRFQPIPTLHSSSYTSTPTGAVWYPVQGEYPPNAGMTWLVNAEGPYNAPAVQMNILSMNFESCSLSDPCLCDALIIYGINALGDLHEVDRQTTGITDDPETTTIFPGPVITTCGGIIEGNSGTVEYAYDSTYDNYEKCIWTIRTSPGNSEVELTKVSSGFESGHDHLTAYGIIPRRGLNKTALLGIVSNDEEQVVMPGPVVILVFNSDHSVTRRGFRLHFRAVGNPVTPVPNYHDFNTGTVPGTLQYPSSGYYSYSELSTFAISKDYSNNANINLVLNSWDFESHGTCGYDGLIVYQINEGNMRQLGLWCGSSTEPQSYSGNAFLFVLYSDHTNLGTGFNASWT